MNSTHLTVAELAQETKESVAVWRKRIYRGEIEHAKLGRNVRVSRAALEAFLRARTVQPDTQKIS